MGAEGRAGCLEEGDLELSVGTKSGQGTLGKVRLGSLHTPRHPGHVPRVRTAQQQERKPCRAGWGSGAGGHVHRSACQLSHSARPTVMVTGPTSLDREPTSARHGVGSSPAGLTKALLHGLQPQPLLFAAEWLCARACLGLSEPICEMGEGGKETKVTILPWGVCDVLLCHRTGERLGRTSLRFGCLTP